VGQRGHSKSRGNIVFSIGKEMKIISWEQGLCSSQNSISSYECRVCWQ
jgi:hypothetical protein